jgi:hypothetical protein
VRSEVDSKKLLHFIIVLVALERVEANSLRVWVFMALAGYMNHTSLRRDNDGMQELNKEKVAKVVGSNLIVVCFTG